MRTMKEKSKTAHKTLRPIKTSFCRRWYLRWGRDYELIILLDYIAMEECT